MAKIRKISAFLLAALMLVTISDSVKAQSWYEEEQRTFYGGAIVGANFTQIDGDRFAGYHKVGLNTGAIVYAHLARHLAASLEILYSQKGSRANAPQASFNRTYTIYEYDINLNYAEIPIQVHYFDKRKSHFGGGFSYSQLISSKETAETNIPVTSPTTGAPVDFEKEFPFKKYDIDFVLSGNLKLWKGLFLNARFQYSILPVRVGPHPDLGRRDQFSNMWTVRLMYLFQ